MISVIKLLTVALTLGATSLGQSGLVVSGRATESWSADAAKVYKSSCLAVQREFQKNRQVRPKVTVIVGARESGAFLESRDSPDRLGSTTVRPGSSDLCLRGSSAT